MGPAALLALAAGAAAQESSFFFQSRVEYRIEDGVAQSGQLEAALARAAPAMSVPGLIVMNGRDAPAPSLFQLFGGFSAFPPATAEYVTIREYDDDDAAAAQAQSPHDFGCPCGADVAALCADAADDGEDAFKSVFEKRLCLARAPALSPACAAHLEEFPTVVERCAADIAGQCAGVQPGDNRIHGCLASRPALAPDCGSYLRAVAPVAGLEEQRAAQEAAEAREMLGAAAMMAREALRAFGLVDAVLSAVATTPEADDAPWDETLNFDERQEAEEAAARVDLQKRWFASELAKSAARQQQQQQQAEQEEAASAPRTKLYLLALALGAASGLAGAVLVVGVVGAALRKKREREAAEEFKAKFAPLLAEAPLEKA